MVPDIHREAFRHQAGACRELGSPFTARLCDLLATRVVSEPRVADVLYGWQNDPGSTGDAVPLRLAGALHGLVLEGRCSALRAVYPPYHRGRSDEELWSALDRALRAHADFILARLNTPPQTNEVRRAAVLLPGFLTIAALTGLPVVLSEIGASAGLNLFWERFGYDLGGMYWGNRNSQVRLRPDWDGPAPPDVAIEVLARAGCDLRPLDPTKDADRLRLLSYVWADQGDRLKRTRAALDIAAREGGRVEKADALAWLERRLAIPQPGATHVVYHTIAWQYLSSAARHRGEALIAAAGARASERAPLAWLRFEGDGMAPGGALTLTLWPSGEAYPIARADYHGRWVRWSGWPPRP